jgi:hypothetical protein
MICSTDIYAVNLKILFIPLYMKKVLLLTFIISFLAAELNSQQLIKDFGNNHIPASGISFTADGRFMVVGGYCKVYDVVAGNIDFRTIKADTETQGDIAFTVSMSRDNRLFLLTKINRIDVWDLQSRSLLKSISDSRLVTGAAGFSGDGKSIIYMRKTGEIVLVNSSTFHETYRQKITEEIPTSIALTPDGKKLFVGTKSNTVIIYDTDRRSTNILLTDSKNICQIDFPRTADYVAIATAEGRIWLGSYPSLQKIRSWQAHTAGFTAISFHPSGKFIASGGKDKMLRVWSLPDCLKKDEWQAHRLALVSVAFSPDGRRIASGSLNDLFAHTSDTKIWSFSGAPEMLTSEVNSSKPAAPVISQPAPVKLNRQEQKRLALVIGNGNYMNSVLANPANDARSVKDVLLQFGFDVLEYEDLNQGRMKLAMDQFGEKLKQYDVGLFFYAGHGIQSKGYNYLIPVDADLKSEAQVEYDCVQADRILALMESSGTKINIIILDACRNNPFERSWTRASSGKGLAFMNAPKGSLIAYATAPGSTASDGSGNNGLYTSAILESIRIPDINILQLFQNVRNIVSEKSGGQQVPWESTSLTGDFFF